MSFSSPSITSSFFYLQSNHEKLKAVKRTKNHQLLFIQSIQHGVFFTLFMLISHHWAPTLGSSVKLFFSVSLPNACSIITSSKFIFIVANAIVVFLIGESKLSKASSKLDIYGEYSMQSQRLQSLASVEVKESEAILEEEPLLVEKPVQEKDEEVGVREEEDKEEEVIEWECEDLVEEEDAEVIGMEEKEEITEEEVVVVVEEDEEVIGVEEEEEIMEDEEDGVPSAEEVNKRAEDFIAMFNMERRREAMMLICYKP